MKKKVLVLYIRIYYEEKTDTNELRLFINDEKIIFSSLLEAYKNFKIKPSTIKRYIEGKSIPKNGYIWKYE